MSIDKRSLFNCATKTASYSFSKGQICSIRTLENTTEFISAKEPFASLAWHRAGTGQAYELFSNLDDIIEDIRCTNHQYFYQARAKDKDLAVEVQIRVADDALHQRYMLHNSGSEAIVLDGLKTGFPSRSTFAWEEDNGSIIMPRVFVAERGSHMIFQRCDGRFPALVCVPADSQSAFEYYDLGQQAAEIYDNTHNSVINLYFHSLERAAQHQSHASALSHKPSDLTLEPGQTIYYSLSYSWAKDNEAIGNILYKKGLATIDVVPGYVVPQGHLIQVSIRSRFGPADLYLCEAAKPLVCETVKELGDDCNLYSFRLNRLGEAHVELRFANGDRMTVVFFVTQAIECLIEKRAAFIADKQIRDKKLWYDGLLAEWNNNTGVLLTPDEYDDIEGWRRYAVTCDDPGLSKPAFLSSKQMYWPEQSEIEALDYYLDNFVWNGLQCGEDKLYPYGIYGIPDWHQNRHSEDHDVRGQIHIWRIYDYPHLFLTYYNMYYVARHYTDLTFTHTAESYLEKAYQTAATMYTLPAELVEWSAYETGLYNELVITDIIKALQDEGQSNKADRLQRFWDRKVKNFLKEGKDIFGSEYSFDTTGFETTEALADRAEELMLLEDEDGDNDPNKEKILPHVVKRFQQRQLQANIACRGKRESAYYWYGSDYRGNNYKYTLSYMSQMGGQALLSHALYKEEDFVKATELLRLAYGSILSSWSLINAGDEESNYGYWFPGIAHDGAASGGFEPLPFGTTWLGPRHRFGPWYYSCEIDLGFCGGLRAAGTIFAEDPVFGTVCYGGEFTYDEEHRAWSIHAKDGLRRRFHILTRGIRVHVDLGTWAVHESQTIRFDPVGRTIRIPLSVRSNHGLTGVDSVRVDGLNISEIKVLPSRDLDILTLTIQYQITDKND